MNYSIHRLWYFLIFLACGFTAVAQDSTIQIVFTSDIHYGITRVAFDGASKVPSHVVNVRMIAAMNTLPGLRLPADQGVRAGEVVGPIDYLMITGDIANREEPPAQSAAASWNQFNQDYDQGLTLKDHRGRPLEYLLVPGNHDLSDAIGFYRKMTPRTDPTSMVGIYNRMMHPAVAKTNATWHFPADKINYSREIGGIHFMFITIWPDSANRIWMEKDLSTVDAHVPVVIVAHDPPDGDAAHFRNPNGAHDINRHDRFEGLLEETSKDVQEPMGKEDGKPTNDAFEQRGFVAFLKAHPNIKAYFHGHNNWNQFYTYSGPDHDVHLRTFRADSPMKGKFSSKDETKLSFQLITIDPRSKTLTVRECLWNTDPQHPGKAPVWGESFTMGL
ncbi:metallophosphoesterase family protein [Puia dinghuensis]|uniref:Calcineurin-like phosphoesterase domain-containing protein n=1 Tax=Puia dinghuensis TaxID=1792502 RepID=A0A8J2XUF1_9BACT|nr:metallophosphoesterase [Puia dinghuensis]GGB25399.1 hypothetical protein GCM10011511_56660 [Puia dinghuensis]